MKKLIQKEISMKELKDFVLSQPDDRQIDLMYSSSESLGCPLVHFVRNKFKRKVVNAGFTSVATDRHVIIFNDVADFMHKLFSSNSTSYKKAKQLIQKFKQ